MVKLIFLSEEKSLKIERISFFIFSDRIVVGKLSKTKPRIPKFEINASLFNHIQSLPIYQYKNQVLEAIERHRVTIISGETGSGKTTQVPQYLLENAKKCQKPVKIICTEPRRIAAVSVSERVAEECSTQVRYRPGQPNC